MKEALSSVNNCGVISGIWSLASGMLTRGPWRQCWRGPSSQMCGLGHTQTSASHVTSLNPFSQPEPVEMTSVLCNQKS